MKTLFDNLYRAFIIKPAKTAGGLVQPRTSPPMSIVENKDEQNEDERIYAAQQRGRSRTTLTAAAPTNDYGTKASPVTFRKLTETSSTYSSSPDDNHNFIGEQIVFEELGSSPQPHRRVTVHDSPTIIRKSHSSKHKQRRSTDKNEYYDSNNNNRGSLKLKGTSQKALPLELKSS